jgi:hypothetical protein
MKRFQVILFLYLYFKNLAKTFSAVIIEGALYSTQIQKLVLMLPRMLFFLIHGTEYFTKHAVPLANIQVRRGRN